MRLIVLVSGGLEEGDGALSEQINAFEVQENNRSRLRPESSMPKIGGKGEEKLDAGVSA